jgi:hypothetical protein
MAAEDKSTLFTSTAYACQSQFDEHPLQDAIIAAASFASADPPNEEDEEWDTLRPSKRVKPSSSHLSYLLELPEELLDSICLSQTMCSPEGGRALSLLSRACSAFGKAKVKKELAFVAQMASAKCKEAGVRRLPVAMGDNWCWPRMVSCLSQCVRVGPHHAHKAIAGVSPQLDRAAWSCEMALVSWKAACSYWSSLVSTKKRPNSIKMVSV